MPQMLACVVAYTARSFRVRGIYSEALRRQGRLESLTTLFERFARNGGERLLVLSRGHPKVDRVRGYATHRSPHFYGVWRDY